MFSVQRKLFHQNIFRGKTPHRIRNYVSSKQNVSSALGKNTVRVGCASGFWGDTAVSGLCTWCTWIYLVPSKQPASCCYGWLLTWKKPVAPLTFFKKMICSLAPTRFTSLLQFPGYYPTTLERFLNNFLDKFVVKVPNIKFHMNSLGRSIKSAGKLAEKYAGKGEDSLIISLS